MKRQLSLLLGVLAAAAGCQKTEATTEIVLEIATDIAVPAGMDTLSLKIGPQANPQAFAKTYPLGPGKVMLPRRMTLVPSSSSTVLSVLVEGLLNTKIVVSRSVITRFVQGESRLLRIELLQKCVGRVCPNQQTCIPSGVCADPNIDPVNLPPFDPKADAGVPVDAPSVTAAGDARMDSAPFDGRSGAERAPTSDGRPATDDRPPSPKDGPGDTVLTPLLDALVGGDGAGTPDGSTVDAPVVASDAPLPLRTRGVACSLSSQCESDLCVDGVCCESKCDGQCMACNVPGKLGTCTFVPLNESSNGDCPDDGVSTCGRNGLCDGLGGCMLYPSGVACSTDACPAGTSTHTRAGLCNGQGICGRGQSQDCDPFLCNAGTNMCSSTCTKNEDCVSPNQCINGSCGKKGNGLPCSTGADCKSDVCAQGVCCSEECTGVCKSCAVDGALGTCTNVPAGKPEVQARCLDQGAATCGTNSMCDGAGACQRYPDSTSCGTRCDAAAATFTTLICGAGACALGATQSCAPYSCDDTGCKKSCTAHSDCAAGFLCGPGGLCVPPPEECMNGVDDDGDGQADCADTDCTAGFKCVPVVPNGFQGPVEFFDGAEASLPSCGESYPVNTFDKVWGSFQCPANCTCSCGSVIGATCAPELRLLGSEESCFDRNAGTPVPIEPGVCTAVPVVSPQLSLTGASLKGKPSGGSCSKAVKPLADPTWGSAARVCGLQAVGGAGCGADSICWPRPQPGFAPQACVFGEGDMVCPSTGYVEKRDYFSSQAVDDTRSCGIGGCGCGTPSGGSCGVSADLFGAPGKMQIACAQDLLRMTIAPQECEFVKAGTITHYRVKVSALPPSGGSCTPTGAGTFTGTCTPSGDQVTLCCAP